MNDVVQKTICACCRKPKSTLNCGLCSGSVCKSCTEFVPQGTFSFMKVIPGELTHDQYCSFCYISHVHPALAAYKETMKQAKSVFIIDKPRRRALPILKQSLEPLLVEECPDQAETVLRLAFLAAEQGFNAVIKASVTCKKVRNGGYQKMIWHGSGFAALLDSGRLEKQAAEESLP